MKHIVIINKMDFPTDDYIYDAAMWHSLDGKTWWHCGFGRYCKTLEEALRYKEEMERGE